MGSSPVWPPPLLNPPAIGAGSYPACVRVIIPRMAGLDPGKDSRAAEGLPVVACLDGFRGAAILGVVLVHQLFILVDPRSDAGLIFAYGPLPNALDALFIISGFVLYLPAAARGGNLGPSRNFLLRRGARLIPGFYLAILTIIVLIWIWPLANAPAQPSAGELAAHVTLIHTPLYMFDKDFPLGFVIDGPLWTLSLEVGFYLLLPLVAARFYRHPFVWLGVAVAITTAWKLAAENIVAIHDFLGLDVPPEDLFHFYRASYSQLPAFLPQFALGMLAAWLLVKLPERYPRETLRRHAVPVQIASLVAFGFLGYLFGREALNFLAFGPGVARASVWLTLAIPLALAALMLATAFAPPRAQFPLAHPAARWFGDISYGVYLIHYPVILFYVALAKRAFGADTFMIDFWVAAPLTLAGSIAFGYLSARLVEQPIRRWAHRFGARASGRPSGFSG